MQTTSPSARTEGVLRADHGEADAGTFPESTTNAVEWATALERHVSRSAEHLLLLTFGLILWMAGFVDLFSHTSNPPDVLGRYSIPFALLLLAYAAGFVPFGWFIFSSNGPDRLGVLIAFVQRRAWFGLGLILSCLVLLATMFVLNERWVRFPLLQASLLLLVALVNGVVLLARPDAKAGMQLWRKAALAVIGAFMGAEVLLQTGALLRVLPGEYTSGLFTPYGRVYQLAETSSHAMANQNGWYYPNFHLQEGAQRIVLVGGSYLLGLEVTPEENMGVLLENRLRMNHRSQIQVISMGVPDYGPAVFLASELFPYTAGTATPRDVIVLFHLANDVPSWDMPRGQVPSPAVSETGAAGVVPEDARLRHDLWHTIIRGYDPQSPVSLLRSHLFSLSAALDVVRSWRGAPAHVSTGYSNLASASRDRPFGDASYLFEPGSTLGQQSLELSIAQLEDWRGAAEAAGARVLLVTLPHFPAAFYERYSGTTWTSQVGQYDLFLPERMLKRYASDRNVPFLPLGEYLHAAQFPVETIRDLYLKDGTGRFTTAGHRVVAEALADCFYGGGGTVCP